jgi:hypothetical protein
MAKTKDPRSPAQKRMDALADRNTTTLRTPKIRQQGIDLITRAREEMALDYCRRRGHRIRGGRANPQGCRPDLQDALMGRLGHRQELPPLPERGVDPVTRFLDGLLSDFGEHDLDGMWEAVNGWREAHGQERITQTACAIRLRELREHARTLLHRPSEGGSGSDVYWYARPEASG